MIGLWGCAGDAPPPPPTQAPGRIPDPAALHLGGTGALTPLFTRLGKTWSHRGGVPPVLVDDSIGSGGGVRATGITVTPEQSLRIEAILSL